MLQLWQNDAKGQSCEAIYCEEYGGNCSCARYCRCKRLLHRFEKAYFYNNKVSIMHSFRLQPAEAVPEDAILHFLRHPWTHCSCQVRGEPKDQIAPTEVAPWWWTTEARRWWRRWSSLRKHCGHSWSHFIFVPCNFSSALPIALDFLFCHFTFSFTSFLFPKIFQKIQGAMFF